MEKLGILGFYGVVSMVILFVLGVSVFWKSVMIKGWVSGVFGFLVFRGMNSDDF